MSTQVEDLEFISDMPTIHLGRKLWKSGDRHFITSQSDTGLGAGTLAFVADEDGRVTDGYLGLKGGIYEGWPGSESRHEEVARAVVNAGFRDSLGKEVK